MARIRSVKPALRTSRVVAQWPVAVRYFWVLLWGYLDDDGRGLDIPRAIAADCFPLDDDMTAAKMDRWLTVIATTKLRPERQPPLCRYEVAGVRYLHAINWPEHQRPNRPTPSVHPPCPVHDLLTESGSEPRLELVTDTGDGDSRRSQVQEFEGLTDGSRGAAAESGSEPPVPPPGPEPPPTCIDHRDDPDPPSCRRCKLARERHEAWQLADSRWQAEQRRRAPRCAVHPTELRDNCRCCRADRLAEARTA